MLLTLVVGVTGSTADSGAADNELIGQVGPGLFITLQKPEGGPVVNVPPGTYTFTINDRSEVHNFHLRGPGVDVATSVEATGMTTWTLTLTDGTYRYWCEPHEAVMRGDFTVGTVAPPPPPPPPPPPASPPKRLVATVAPGPAISLKTAGGAAVRTLKAGAYTVEVRDRSRRHSFRLGGHGVSRSTGVHFMGKATWKLTFHPGVYRFSAGGAGSKRGSFRVL